MPPPSLFLKALSRAASEEYSLNDSEGGARGFIVEELPDKVTEAEVMRILMVQPVVHFPDGHILVAMEIGDILVLRKLLRSGLSQFVKAYRKFLFQLFGRSIA